MSRQRQAPPDGIAPAPRPRHYLLAGERQGQAGGGGERAAEQHGRQHGGHGPPTDSAPPRGRLRVGGLSLLRAGRRRDRLGIPGRRLRTELPRQGLRCGEHRPGCGKCSYGGFKLSWR